jgi:hypothetical protein
MPLSSKYAPMGAARTFIVYEGPSCADPSFLCPVREIHADGSETGYMGTGVLRKALDKIDEQIMDLAMSTCLCLVGRTCPVHPGEVTGNG